MAATKVMDADDIDVVCCDEVNGLVEPSLQKRGSLLPLHYLYQHNVRYHRYEQCVVTTFLFHILVHLRRLKLLGFRSVSLKGLNSDDRKLTLAQSRMM